ncbi:PIG-L deacetylase family protein [Streptomyces sp. NBC_00083]|uniref:PIG-L deacetylase family protein n=1 Tax=Streptomyces sp. NBC_00083 TaxID=2975647 RepID=UPI00224D70D5|nr:PIG-L deacetylase family protein [Streptomyces sp. NBC_00083]MCX5387343.1 PIG-L family deacetylase [Streptomyces sp. NBC_00083]
MKVLVLAAHPDDEVLGAGATVSALSRQGADVRIHVLAEGVSLRHSGVTMQEARERCRAAAKELGASEVSFGGLAADGRLLADLPQRQVVDAVGRVVREAAAEVVFTHHPGDIHADHRSVAQAVGYGTRILGSGSVRQVLHFEVLSSTEQQTGLVAPFVPTVFYDVTGHVEAKCRALAAYPYEVYDAPHPRSLTAVRTLAAYRGTQVGVEAAEAFAVGRELRAATTADLDGGDAR